MAIRPPKIVLAQSKTICYNPLALPHPLFSLSSSRIILLVV